MKVVRCVKQAVININYAFCHIFRIGLSMRNSLPRRQFDSVISRTHLRAEKPAKSPGAT
jgi:hypothetical protein